MNYRGYIISPHPVSPTMYVVATEGRGGRIPQVLDGAFTSLDWVRKLIDEYLDSVEVKKRGKANTTE